MNPAEDGKTHVNVYSKGKTLLGRLLSNFANTPFVHPEDGEFASVEGYWYWLSCKDDALRGLHGFNAKKYGRSVRAADWRSDDEFKRKVCLALKSKVDQNLGLMNLLRLNKLPLVHYYVYQDKVVVPEDGKWILEFWQSLSCTHSSVGQSGDL